MCGIAAILGTDIPPDSIDRMTACLNHRGPDASGIQHLPDCDFGHRRLSIIDLSGGSQPMCDETGRYWLIFNGEIYNYRALRRTLQSAGYAFRTQSDTEVILQGYRQYGKNVVQHLNGQFAFLIWDTQERRLFAARDRAGEKPLYYAQDERGRLFFASEIKAILAAGHIKPWLDLAALDAFLALLYVPPDRTIYSNIQTLPPAHTLTWQDGQLAVERYWQPRYSCHPAQDIREILPHLQQLIARAIERQMVADVPVAAFLSGGLDSTTIVAHMTRYTEKPVMTFSVGFGDLINELPYARAVAEQYRTDHHEMQMDIPLGDLLPQMVQIYDEPFADSSNIPTYLIAQFAAQHVKVVLSGDGGDELFGGYGWYTGLLFDLRKQHTILPEMALSGLIALTYRIMNRAGLPVTPARDAAVFRFDRLRALYGYPDLWARHVEYRTYLKDRERANLWNALTEARHVSPVQPAYVPDDALQGIDPAVDFDVRCYLPGDILVKVDRAAMAGSLESRAPFLDVDLMEFVLGLPWQMRFATGPAGTQHAASFRQHELKPLLKAACGDLMPASVRTRGKQGFGAPLEAWMQRPEVQTHLQRVTRTNSPLLAVLPGTPLVLPRLDPQQQWTLLCLGLWLEAHPECLS